MSQTKIKTFIKVKISLKKSPLFKHSLARVSIIKNVPFLEVEGPAPAPPTLL